jgi:hypothetical protein
VVKQYGGSSRSSVMVVVAMLRTKKEIEERSDVERIGGQA